MLSNNVVIEVVRDSWVFIGVVWLVGRFVTKRTAVSQPRGHSSVYFGLLMISFLLLFDMTPLRDFGFFHDRPEIFGCTLLVAGVLGALWSRLVLARNWSGGVALKEDHELVARGPYRRVRHPMYTSLLLMVLGTALVRGTAQSLAAFIIFLLIHLWKIRAEEILLTQHFGQSYAAYKARTKALIPFLI